MRQKAQKQLPLTESTPNSMDVWIKGLYMTLKIFMFIWIPIVFALITGCALEKNYNSPFISQYVSGQTQPEVLVQNKTDRTIQVNLWMDISNESRAADKIVTILPSQSINIVVDPGEYEYSITCPNVEYLHGYYRFQKNYRYSSEIYIERKKY